MIPDREIKEAKKLTNIILTMFLSTVFMVLGFVVIALYSIYKVGKWLWTIL